MKLLELGSPHPGAPPRGYVARWRDPIDRRWRQQSMAVLGITTRPAAEGWCKQRSKSLLEIRAQVAAGGALAVRKTFEEATRDYLAGFKEGTAKGKRTVLVALSNFLSDQGVTDVCDLPAPLLARWRDALTKGHPRKLAATTINRWLEAAAAFVRWNTEQGYAPTMTDDAIKRSLKRVSVARDAIEFLQPRELHRLLDAALRHDARPRDPLARGPRPPVAPLLLLAITTGMRAAELFGLRWDEIDFTAEAVRLPAARVKTQQARAIGLQVSPTATALLRALRLRSSASLVLPDWSASTWDNTRMRLLKMRSPVFTLHTLRRSTGTYLANAPGVPLSTWAIAKRMGHGVQLAEKHYVGALAGLPADAKTLEAAVGIEELAGDIITAAGGLVRVDDGREVAQ